jgi:hypothetical protein
MSDRREAGKKSQPRPAKDGVVEVSGRRPDDVAVARLAKRQRGRVTTKQLRRAGLGDTGMSRRAEDGKLHREHQGVYAVGHEAKPRWADEASALLAGGDEATIAYRSCLEVWGVLPPRPGRRVDIVVTTPRANRPGITVHRTRRLDPRDVTRRWDMRVTTIERALLDAAEQIDHK